MKKSWTKFKLATGEIEELNKRVYQLACEFIEHNPTKVPTKVVFGLDWGMQDATAFWLGELGGEVKIERVAGKEVRIE